MDDSTGTTERTYDPLNRVLTKIVPGLGTTTFTYDITSDLTAGHVGSSTTDPKSNTVTRIYDKAGRLHQVKDGSVITATYTYYDNGNLQKLQYPASSEEYTYYPNNRMHTLVNKIGSTIIDAYSYGYDAAGNQTSKVDGKGTTNYTYDQLNRLASVSEPGGKLTSYTYDPAGNRQTETVSTGSISIVTTYTYNEQTRLLHTERP